jgi:glycosyltransferase involved in cell wall biosynthesis
MKILFFTQVLPYPLNAGPKVRAYYVLRHLAQQHEITLVSFVRSTDTPEALAHLKSFCAAVHTVPMPRSPMRDGYHLLRSLINQQPFIIARDWNGAMVRKINELLRAVESGAVAPFAAIHADQLWMAPYALLAQQQQQRKRAMTVLDQHNAVFMIPERLAGDDANLPKRLLLQWEARKMAHYEVAICQRFDHLVWVTQEDYQAVQQQANRLGQRVPGDAIIPICGDSTEQPPIQRAPTAQRITFVGGLHYPPNAQGICWFAETVFPQVLAQAPQSILTVIGKQPPPALQKLGIPPQNLAVTGFVERVEPYLAETAAFVAPLLAGGGMRVKIIDGWRWGMPVVSTTIGAEGIAIHPEENILIADTPAAFAERTLQLLQSPQKAHRLATAGRHWFETHYDWRHVYQQWDRIYR